MAHDRTIQLYRGTTAQNDAFTGAAGEVTVDTQTHELRVHDGSTVGGHIIYTKTKVDTALSGKANTDMDNLTRTKYRKLVNKCHKLHNRNSTRYKTGIK